MATNISMDPETLLNVSTRVQEDSDAIGAASDAVPTNIDAGDGSQVVADIISAIAVWAATTAEVHTALAHITRQVANETMANESEAITQLNSIDEAVNPFS